MHTISTIIQNLQEESNETVKVRKITSNIVVTKVEHGSHGEGTWYNRDAAAVTSCRNSSIAEWNYEVLDGGVNINRRKYDPHQPFHYDGAKHVKWQEHTAPDLAARFFVSSFGGGVLSCFSRGWLASFFSFCACAPTLGHVPAAMPVHHTNVGFLKGSKHNQ